jgi:hypothetical protein
MAYVAAKAKKENAMQAMRGSPSPWKVFAIIANDTTARERRVADSVFVSADGPVVDDMVVGRIAMW